MFDRFCSRARRQGMGEFKGCEKVHQPLMFHAPIKYSTFARVPACFIARAGNDEIFIANCYCQCFGYVLIEEDFEKKKVCTTTKVWCSSDVSDSGC